MTDRPIQLEATIDALLIALALQASDGSVARFAPSALDELASQGRSVVKALLGSIGHLVHYGCGPDGDQAERSLAQLFEDLVAALRRSSSSSAAMLLPGDVVELTVDSLDDGLKAGTIMRVYWVGDDGTVDVGFPELWEEYLIFSVQLEQLRKA